MTAADVTLESVWKQYRLGTARHAEVFWALRDVSLAVPGASTFGIIGRNGAGKSTLLKLLAGITAPTRGRIVIAGRVAALIEVGSGFHPELTGRENVFLSGAILGMRRREIAAKLESIVEFAGVRPFIDTPVKWYSSGMYVRLGFSIAAHLEPEVLLVDEVLAVGDAEFQVKCLERINAMRRQGVTIVFISHDLTAVEQLCDAAILLEKGTVAAEGHPSDVVARYHRQLVDEAADAAPPQAGGASPGAIRLTNLTFQDSAGHARLGCRTGEPLSVRLRYSAARPIPGAVFEISYYSGDGKTLFASASNLGRPLAVSPPGGTIEFTCPAVPFRPGSYYVGAVVRDARTSHVIDWWDGGSMLHVEAGARAEGLFYMPHTWRLTQDAPAETGARS